jgi:hypothetical protein
MNDMFDIGVRNPRRNMLICLGVTLLALVVIAWGVWEMHLAGEETMSSGAKIGIGLLPAILGPAMALNFWRGVRVFAAARRGENLIGRWTVYPADLPAFTAIDDARNAHGGVYRNVWTAPRELPKAGLEIIFVADGVLVGDIYFALVTTGAFRFTGVGLLTDNLPAIEFSTEMTTIREGRSGGTPSPVGVIRLPIPRHGRDEATKVVDYFRRVVAREIIVNPGFYRRRMWVGLIGAPIFFAVAIAGHLLDGDGIPDLMLGLGLLAGGAMSILAFAAYWLGRAKHRKA